MTETEKNALGAWVELDYPQVDGWSFNIENGGYFVWSKGDTQIWATPDFEGRAGTIAIDVHVGDEEQEDVEDLRYEGDLMAPSYVELMRPVLARWASP